MIAPTTRYAPRAAELEPPDRPAARFVVHKQIMGGRFRFRSSHEALLDLVEAAYGGHAPHQLPAGGPEFDIELDLSPRRDPVGIEPPPVRTQLGAGRVLGFMDDDNYVLISPQQRRARVVASEDMLGHAYHLRYELIEFAVFILATRGQRLVPLHAACLGGGGRGLLLLGASGSGKSTLALHGLLQGLEFLAEDAVFVQPDSMLATGVASYLHVQADALDTIDDMAARRWIASSPVIHRRSGVAKFEVDLRRAPAPARLAQQPLQLVGAVMVSNQRADDPGALLTRLVGDDIAARLRADQPYAKGQPGWHGFERRMVHLGMHELRRGRHPRSSVDALRQLLG